MVFMKDNVKNINNSVLKTWFTNRKRLKTYLRRNTNGQNAHDKTGNITKQQGNVN